MYYILFYGRFENKDFLFKNVSTLKGVGKKLTLYLKIKKLKKLMI